MKEHLLNDQQQAKRAKQLATIKRDAPVKVSLDDLAYKGDNLDTLTDFYERMGFKSFLSKLGVEATDADNLEKVSYTKLSHDNLSELTKFKQEVSFYLEMDDDNYHTANIVGFSIGHGDKWFAANEPALLREKPLAAILADKTIQKNVFDAKRTYVGLHRESVDLENVDFDMLLVSYLLNTTNNSNDVGTVAKLHGFANIKTDEEVYAKGPRKRLTRHPRRSLIILCIKQRQLMPCIMRCLRNWTNIIKPGCIGILKSRLLLYWQEWRLPVLRLTQPLSKKWAVSSKNDWLRSSKRFSRRPVKNLMSDRPNNWAIFCLRKCIYRF